MRIGSTKPQGFESSQSLSPSDYHWIGFATSEKMKTSSRSVFSTGIALAAFVASSVFSFSLATDVFVDPFNDNSGGVPGGWFDIQDGDTRPGTAVTETGGAVLLTDIWETSGDDNKSKFIQSTDFNIFPAGSNETVLELKINSVMSTGSALPEAFFSIGNNTAIILIRVKPASNQLEIMLQNPFQAAHTVYAPLSPYFLDYDGSELTLQVILGVTGFRVVSTSGPSFDSGALSFSNSFAFGVDTIYDFGPNALITLASVAQDMAGSATTSFDYVSYTSDTTIVTPPPAVSSNVISTSIANQIKKLKKKLKKSRKNKRKAKKIKAKLRKLKKKLSGL